MSARGGSPWAAAAAVVDPEIQVVTIEDLGILRDVRTDPATGRVTVTITPTYSGCPAMDAIRADIRAAVAATGHPDVDVVTALGEPWTTDWITESGRAKLAAAGIAPPPPAGPTPAGTSSPAPADAASAGPVPPGVVGPAPGARGLPLLVAGPAPACPRCESVATEEVSRFGSTACKALWRCRACAEPFDHVKAF